MLFCSNCEIKIESEKVGLYTICPSCGIGFMITEQDVQDYKQLGLEIKRMDAALDSFGIDGGDYEEAGLEMPEHPNCHCSNELDEEALEQLGLETSGGNDYERGYDYIEEQDLCENCEFSKNAGQPFEPNISFHDLDVNEIVLLTLPIEEPVPIDHITDMNYRFLHTFIDSCFVPV